MNPLSFLGFNDQEAAEVLEYFREYLPGQRPRGGEGMSDLNELLRQAREARPSRARESLAAIRIDDDSGGLIFPLSEHPPGQRPPA